MTLRTWRVFLLELWCIIQTRMSEKVSKEPSRSSATRLMTWNQVEAFLLSFWRTPTLLIQTATTWSLHRKSTFSRFCWRTSLTPMLRVTTVRSSSTWSHTWSNSVKAVSRIVHPLQPIVKISSCKLRTWQPINWGRSSSSMTDRSPPWHSYNGVSTNSRWDLLSKTGTTNTPTRSLPDTYSWHSQSWSSTQTWKSWQGKTTVITWSRLSLTSFSSYRQLWMTIPQVESHLVANNKTCIPSVKGSWPGRRLSIYCWHFVSNKRTTSSNCSKSCMISMLRFRKVRRLSAWLSSTTRSVWGLLRVMSVWRTSGAPATWMLWYSSYSWYQTWESASSRAMSATPISIAMCSTRWNWFLPTFRSRRSSITLPMGSPKPSNSMGSQ